MKIQIYPIAYFVFFLLVSTACSPKFTVGADKDPQVNFSNYLTFRQDTRQLFTRRSNPLLNSELTKKRINNTINALLTEKGYQMVAQEPDFIFSFQTEVRSRQDISYQNAPMTWGYWSRWNSFPNQPRVRDYEEMTLIIDVKDAKNLALIWQGWVIGELKYSAETWAERIEESVRKAMMSFPTHK